MVFQDVFGKPDGRQFMPGGFVVVPQLRPEFLIRPFLLLVAAILLLGLPPVFHLSLALAILLGVILLPGGEREQWTKGTSSILT